MEPPDEIEVLINPAMPEWTIDHLYDVIGNDTVESGELYPPGGVKFLARLTLRGGVQHKIMYLFFFLVPYLLV